MYAQVKTSNIDCFLAIMNVALFRFDAGNSARQFSVRLGTSPGEQALLASVQCFRVGRTHGELKHIT
jgi:hypothetical protein